MEAHVRVVIETTLDLNTLDCVTNTSIDACEDMPETMVFDTAMQATAEALGEMTKLSKLQDMLGGLMPSHVVVVRHSEKEEKHDGSADAGEPEKGV